MARRSFALSTGAVLVGALVIRLVGVSWGLPYVYHPDEPTNYSVFHEMVHNRTLNPHFFNYPSLFFDINAFVHGITGSGPLPMMESGANGFLTNSTPMLIARLVTVAFGVGIVAAGMGLAWLITRRRSTAVLAGVLCAIHPILVRNSRWVTPDTLAGFTATLAVVAAVVVARSPRTRNYVLAGVATGLAVSAKYNVVVVAVALVVAHVIARRDRAVPARNLAWAAGAALVTFFVTTPYALLSPHAFWHDVSFEYHHYQTGHAGAEGDAPLVNFEWLWGATGPFLLAVFGLPFVSSVVRRWCYIPGAFVVVYGVLVSAQSVRFERNLVPLLPSLLAVLAVVAVEVFDRIDARAWRYAAVALAVLLLSWPLAFAVRDTVHNLDPPQARARKWIASQLPQGATVVLEAYSPYVDPQQFHVVAFDKDLLRGRDIERVSPDAVIVTQSGSGRYLVAGNTTDARRTRDWLRDHACDVVSFGQPSERIWVYRLHC
jgi:4-amino-4-deoxy-L-arabinose transferase-like glycosyltransferase